ncbi:MAG: hypothetical protein CW338_12380 [Clostridiales bacterium]|nr:hypothetical protein [Clostridiales bacterium]
MFNLMIDGYWNDVHGIFYPDGTVRDPSIIAAMMGCYRNRNTDTIVPEKPNREQFVRKVIEKAAKYLEDSTPDAFAYKENDREEMLEICDEMANLLEAGQLTAMCVPPTAKVAAFRRNESVRADIIRRMMYDFGRMLKEECMLL